ncbi:MAG: carbohydrate ABC transporter permease [Candidatus Atribacteria bacterium]|nr:carbohydrate ABC transporter permease [Candidatus Atribacteria bacterium]
MMRKGRANLRKIVVYVAIAILCFLFVFPMYWMITTTFKLRTETIVFPQIYYPRTPNIDAYRHVFATTQFPLYFRNTVIAGVFGTLIGLAFGIPAAYGASRFNFKGKNDLMFLILSTRFLPPITAVLPLYILYRNYQLLDSLLGLSLIYAAISIPLTSWVLKTYFDEIPRELEESYMLDGHSRLKTFFRIVMPLSAPGIVSVSLLSIVGSWGEFLFALVLTSTQSAKTIPVGVAELSGDIGILWQEICVFGVFALIPVVVFMIAIQRNLIRGLTMGALK